MAKRRGGSGRQLHPLVRVYIDSPDDFNRALSESSEPAAKALLALRGSLSNPGSRPDAEALAQAVRVEKCDPDLAVLLLSTWMWLVARLPDLLPAKALVRQAGFLLSECTPEVVRAALVRAESRLAGIEGFRERSEQLHRETLDLLPQDSPHYWGAVANHLLQLAQEGRLEEARSELAWFSGRPARENMADFVRYVNLLECARPMEATGLLPKIGNIPGLVSYGRGREFESLLMLLRGKLRPGSADNSAPRPAFPAGMQPAEEPPAWIVVLDHLFSRRPQDALALVRRTMWRDPRIELCLSRFGSFNLIRAELACGNGAAARRLLGLRREGGAAHHLDDLFLARAELLAGNREAAAAHAAAAGAACRRYGAEPRLELELELACELSLRDAAWLLAAAEAPAAKAAPPRATAPEAGPLPSPEPATGTARLVGDGTAMRRIRESVRQIARSELPVLITGETGTGKDLVARALHECSPRREEPFVAVNCGAIPESLLESELFGYDKGAFIGAERAHRGLFAEAENGTVLLKDIDRIPARLQPALLRVLESGEIRPVGARRARKVGCRVLAGTSADLARMVREGRFLADLSGLLGQRTISVPPLRERREDIAPLALHFLAEGRPDAAQPTISADLRKALSTENWPGNVRELRGVVERARLLNSEKLAYELPDFRLPSDGPTEKAALKPPAKTKSPATPRGNARAGRYAEYLGEYAGVSAYDHVAKVIEAMSDACWGQADAQAAWDLAQGLRLDRSIPVPLVARFLISWVNLASLMRRYAEAESMLRHVKGLVPGDAPAEVRRHVISVEGLIAANRGNVVRREKLCRQVREIAGELKPYYRISDHCNFAHLLATLGRASELDEDRKALGSVPKRSREHLLLIDFIQAVETGRFADAAAMAGAVRKLDWDNAGHRAFFLRFMELAGSRWKLVAAAGDGPVAKAASPEGAETLPSWAATLDHLLAGRPRQALESAQREAGEDLLGCLTKVGLDSFNLIRAELANGNWQAAVRLIGLRRARGNVHYLDDYFLAVACLLAGQRHDAAAHMARVRESCAKHSASGRLAFELRMVCGLSPSDALWLNRGGDDPLQTPAAGAPAPKTHEATTGLDRLKGPSAAMQRVRENVGQIASSELPVLITGETGTGKDLVARAIHECSPRREEPFVAVNCGAIPESLLESELFGHEKGAFTGAERAHRGLFAEAGAGTVLLDEIGEIPSRLQVALLRVLESGEIRPVGASRTLKVGCRVLAATNAELEKAVKEGRFRADLFYRLRRLALHIPPLRERREDVGALALYFLNEGRPACQTASLDPELEAELRARDWPGNVRELRNEMERMRLLNSDALRYSLASAALAGGAASTPPSPADASPGEPDQSTETPKPNRPSGAEEVKTFLQSGRTRLRRLERLRALFREHKTLTRTEAAHILEVALATATTDLKRLCREGIVEKVTPSASPSTHYFALKERETGDR